VNIQAVAQKTGVPAATLRKWEQRYGVLKPERTAGAHRRYSERDVLRVEWLKARLGEGYRIGEAARLLGGPAFESPPCGTDELVEEIVEATAACEPARIHRAVDHALSLHDPAVAIAEVVEPAMRRIGDCWAEGELGVGQEHAATEIVRAKLRELLDPAGEGPRGRAVLACAPGERHEIGLLALAVLLQADGWCVVYLGADTPLPEAVAVAIARDASLLCLSATMDGPGETVRRDLGAISTENGFRVLAGGAAFGGPSTVEAVEDLRRRAVAA
jgi:methanogenic corrinoid protein MtbC1